MTDTPTITLVGHHSILYKSQLLSFAIEVELRDEEVVLERSLIRKKGHSTQEFSDTDISKALSEIKFHLEQKGWVVSL